MPLKNLPRFTARLLAALLYGLLCGVLLAGCGGGGHSGDDAPAVAEASATIGVAGGTLEGPDGVRVEVPPGALTRDTVIRVAKTAVGAPGTLPEGIAPVPVYEFTPHGIDFNLPVTISMPTPAGDPAQRQVFMASPGDSEWRSVNAGGDASRTAWQVMGFSWAIIADACNRAAGDAFPCQWPQSNGFMTATPASALSPAAYQVAHNTPLALNDAIWGYQLNAPGAVDVRFRYSGARDCQGTVRVTRWQPSVRDANGRIIVNEVLPRQAVVLSPSPNRPGRAEGQTPPLPITFTSEDNGEHVFGMSFICVRRGHGTLVGGQVRLTVAIPVEVLVAPAVTTQPAAVNVQEPAAATFTVAATGTPVPTVQWQRSNDGGTSWADIPGATSPSHTTGATTAAADDASQYRAVVTNSQGVATSQPAVLGVAAPSATQTEVIAGAIGSAGLVNAPSGPGSAARLGAPSWLARDAAGNVYVSEDRTLDIRKITPQGVVTTFANGRSGLVNPKGLAVASDGTVYVADGNEIKAITPAGVVSALSGLRDSARLQPVTFNDPRGLAISGAYPYVADFGNVAIKRIDLTNGTVYTMIEGSAGQGLPVDGCSGATLTRPVGIAVNDVGFLWWSEENNTIRFKGECVATVAGSPNAAGYADGSGSDAVFSSPQQLSLDRRGNLYVADFQNSVLRRIELRGAGQPGTVTTVFGVGQDATTVAGPNGRIAYPLGVLVVDGDTLLATSYASHVVLRVTAP
jgi:hypothetical protein